MNWKNYAEDHKRNSDKYLDDTNHGYRLNSSSGLYEPNTSNAYEAPQVDPHKQIKDQRPKATFADWFTVIFTAIGLVISLLTLIGLFFTAMFSLRQWEEAHRTVNASLIQAQVAQDSLWERR